MELLLYWDCVIAGGGGGGGGYYLMKPLRWFVVQYSQLFLFWKLFVTTRNEVGASLYFHRRLWFCPQGVPAPGGCLLPGGVPAPGGSALAFSLTSM